LNPSAYNEPLVKRDVKYERVIRENRRIFMGEIEKTDIPSTDNSNWLYDRLCIVLILFITLVSILNWNNLYPNPVDSYYHMAVIRAFSDSGGLVLHDYWEFAPAGRPHLYAPTTHLIGFILSLLGLSMSVIGRVMSWLPYPLSFVVMWLWLRNAIGARGAFFALALLAGPADWFFSQTAHWANVFVLLLAPLAFLFFEKQKYFIATTISILACYAHGSGLLVPAAILLYGIHRPSLFKPAIISAAVSIIAFAPWLIHVYANRNLMTTARPSFLQIENFRVFVFPMPLALAGIFLAYRHRGNSLILPCFLLSFIVMFPMGYAHRFWQFNSIMPYAALAGFALTVFLEWIEKRFQRREYGLIATIAVLLVSVTLNPVISFGGRGMPAPPTAQGMQQPAKDQGAPQGIRRPMGANTQRQARMANNPRRQGGFRFEQTAIARMLNGTSGMQMGGNSMDSDSMTAMISLVEEYAGKNDIVAANTGPMSSCLIPAMTGIRITDGMLREVQSEESQPRFKEANFVVMQQRNSIGPQGAPGGPPTGDLMGRDATSPPKGFEFIAEKDGIQILKNPSAEQNEFSTPKPVLTLPLIIIIILGISGLIFTDIYKTRMPKKLIIGATAFCIIICVASIMPLTISAIGELSDQPERPAGLDRQMPFPGGGIGGAPPFGSLEDLDIPPRIARKYTRLMRSVHEEMQNGGSPDHFLPREKAMEIRNLLEEKRFPRAEKLINEALEILDGSPTEPK
jgi:hypothetical protein